MLKGLALTPPIIGRIAIGKVVEKNGKRLPEKDDEFTLTSQIQGRDGWINHPLDESLRAGATGKLRSIPVRLLFDDPELNFRANYSLFDRATGRLICVGNGETCKRITSAGLQQGECPSPDFCPLAANGACKPYGRLNVRVGDDDELGSFVFRTTGYNSIRTLSARLRYFDAVSGGRLATLPLELRLRGKSTTQSRRAPIYYVDLTVRTGMSLNEAIAAAHAESQDRISVGFDQAALDAAARLGFMEGAFEDSVEESAAIVEEFYPGTNEAQESSTETPATAAGSQPSLSDKLRQQSARRSPAQVFPALDERPER